MKAKHALLVRHKETDKETFGRLYLFDENGEVIFQCVTNELPWKENRTRISCIPDGAYFIEFRTIGKYANESFHVTEYDGGEVNGRSFILIHYGNFEHDTLGCILAGHRLLDIDGDDDLDITSSKATMSKLIELIDRKKIPFNIVSNDGNKRAISST